MTARSLRLLDLLDAHRAAFSARLDALPSAAVHAQPSPGVWSLAQLAEHLLLIDGGLLADGPPISSASRATSWVRSRGIQSILALPLRIEGPPSAVYVMPSASPQWPDVRERWAGRRSDWGSWSARPGTVAFAHPIAGPFLWDDALAFLLAHHRHHDAQVGRILKTVG